MALTFLDAKYCAAEVLGIDIPAFLNDQWVKPEQSKPVAGLEPPHT